jgi:ferrous iron transport protein B
MMPIPGFIIACMSLWLMYEFVGVFGAGYLVNLLERRLFGDIINPWLTIIVNHTFPWAHVRDFLIGRFGLLTMAVTYALAIVLPIVATFFFIFGFLEDSGYLPRLSAIMDRFMRLIGLNGKAVLPMILGLGCGTMATLTTRVLETKKERLLVILLLALGVPCSAQLGVTLGMLSGMSLAAALIWVACTLGSMMVVGAIANKILPGSRSCFIIEIPPLRRPLLLNVLVKIKMRMVWYLKEAVPLFILGTAILFFLDAFGVLRVIEQRASPLITGVLGLPAQTTGSFIMGFLRRDYGSAGLYVMAKQGLLSPRQMLVSIMVITLFVPCVAQFFMMIKERGWKTASAIFVFVTAYAFAFGGMLNMALAAIHF